MIIHQFQCLFPYIFRYFYFSHFNTTSKESVLLQGIIDLLAVSDNEAIIIDYKYSSSNLETLKTRYAKQLELYAYALEKATGIKVKTKALVNIYKGESVIID